jgi:hypothetical protein
MGIIGQSGMKEYIRFSKSVVFFPMLKVLVSLLQTRKLIQRILKPGNLMTAVHNV